MKRINEYKKLFQIEKEINLAELKTTYRKLVKQWHPDKFQDGDPPATARVLTRGIVNLTRSFVRVRSNLLNIKKKIVSKRKRCNFGYVKFELNISTK